VGGRGGKRGGDIQRGRKRERERKERVSEVMGRGERRRKSWKRE
jgi:hypothetical protein